MKPEYRARYADLLTGADDEALDRLVQELDAEYTAPPLPADLSWAIAQQRLQQSPQPVPGSESLLQPIPLARWRTVRRGKVALIAVAAAIVVALLSAALLNGIGALHILPGQQTQASVLTDVQLLQQLIQNKGTPLNIQQLDQSGQLMPINITSRIHDVHIQKVYADANNVIVFYTIDQSAWHQSMACLSNGDCQSQAPLTLKTAGGQRLPEVAERADFGKQPAGENKLVALIAYYDVSVIQGNPAQLTLTVSFSRRLSSTQQKLGTFTLPVHQEKKVLKVHQTVVSHGLALTLERVVITPSEARFYRSFHGSPAVYSPSFPISFGNEELSIEGKSYSFEPFPDDGSGDVYGWFAPDQFEPSYASLNDGLMGQTGKWVFTEHAVDDHYYAPNWYTWTFTFTVS